jgi:hypothetical protein
MARKSFLATLVGVAAIVVPSAFADQGGIPHDGSSGQGRPATQPAAAKSQGKAVAKGHAKAHAKAHVNAGAQGKALAKGHATAQANVQATSHGKALAKGHAKTQGAPTTNTHAKAGKTTICHATGSATNPFVTITISNNALPAHRRHQDGRDIIPAPAGGCPGAGVGGPQPPQGEEGKTTICHATGSATNPFVLITISNSAIPAHQAHQDGRDIIPAPAGGCPAAGVSGQQPPAGVTPGQQPPAVQTPAAAPGQVLGTTTTGPSGKPNVNVLGETTSGRAPSASSSPAAQTTREAGSKGLPFTGTDAILLGILGLAALLLGVTVRRASTYRV